MDSIRAARVKLLGEPVEEARALVIPSAQWGHPMCTPESVWRTVGDGVRSGVWMPGPMRNARDAVAAIVERPTMSEY